LPGTISIFGSAQAQPGSPAYKEARLLGQLLVQAGFAVVTGGYSGTMEGASRGASEAGGEALGITCAAFDAQRSSGNRYLTREIHTPDLLERLREIVSRSDGYVVLSGGVGTLLELFLVWNLLAIGVTARPCVLIGHRWTQVLDELERLTAVEPRHTALLHVVDTPEEAVALLLRALGD